MSPYIVTTKRHEAERDHGDGPPPYAVLSRRAVATLDEARREVQGGWTWHQVCAAIPESGGTVGPLPDGTVIEVEATTWERLWSDSGLAPKWLVERAEAGDPKAQQRILEAYNARQEVL